jgi:hypothetical protein
LISRPSQVRLVTFLQKRRNTRASWDSYVAGFAGEGLMRALTGAFFVVMFLFVSHVHGNLHAYLDPGTGSIALQLVLGVLVAGIATLRLYWQRLKAYVHRTPNVADDASEGL